MDIKWQLSSG